ncbi:amidohydrolase family protein [Paraburkholderia sp. G-4-1-8]|uniref:Amidohydrolase family protein n=1 Tax=Paraburkholderia antibiotica TaxID=2728839 RepID=A0A7Y0A2M4_9BURK|nr:amidohydrolase family protein [Paraburkholderia antibiotica]
MRLGDGVEEVLASYQARAPERFRGIRHMAAWDASPEVSSIRLTTPADLLLDPDFRKGYAVLGRMGISFDAWLFHPQLPQLIDLIDAVPDTPVILNHLGGRTERGPYAGKSREIFESWRKSIVELARRPNVTIKLGGIGMASSGLGFPERALPPTSDDLVAAWKPYVATCIEAFGVGRAMFESNFPVDKTSCSYRVLWNAFKKIAAGCSAAEKARLFAGTAMDVYRISL